MEMVMVTVVVVVVVVGVVVILMSGSGVCVCVQVWHHRPYAATHGTSVCGVRVPVATIKSTDRPPRHHPLLIYLYF